MSYVLKNKGSCHYFRGSLPGELGCSIVLSPTPFEAWFFDTISEAEGVRESVGFKDFEVVPVQFGASRNLTTPRRAQDG